MIRLVVAKHRDAIYKYEKLGKYANKEYLAAHFAFVEAPLEWMLATEKWPTTKKL